MKISKSRAKIIIAFLLFSFLSNLYAGISLQSSITIPKLASKSVNLLTGSPVISEVVIKPSSLNSVRGDFGESITDLDYFSRLSGTWTIVSPRQGRQGLDHLYLEFKDNLPRSCLIADTKVNSSKLGSVENNTVTQMSYKWRTDRVSSAVNQYDELLKLVSSGLVVQKTPAAGESVYSKYPISPNSYYWKDSEGSLFLCNADKVDASEQTKIVRDYLDAVAHGRVDSRNRLVHYSLEKDGSIIETVYAVNDIGENGAELGNVLEKRSVSGRVAKEAIENESEILNTLASKYGISVNQLKILHLSGEEYVELVNYTGIGVKPSAIKKVEALSWGKTIGASVGFGVGFDIVYQLVTTKTLDSQRLLRVGLVSSASAIAFRLGRLASDAIGEALTKSASKETVSAVVEKGTKVTVKALGEVSETAAKEGGEAILKTVVKEGVSNVIDFGIGFAIDGIGIHSSFLRCFDCMKRGVSLG